jgi:membrane protein implicated in regulation of membrane protease activity
MTLEIAFWIALLVLFVVIEASTVSLYCSWFALGSLMALIPALTGGPFWLQLVVFAVVSAASLALLRPLFKQYIKGKQGTPTNSDRNIGESGICTQRICNSAGQGAVRLMGKEWTARSAGDTVIEEGAPIRVESISGVKLIVSEILAEQSPSESQTPETAAMIS